MSARSIWIGMAAAAIGLALSPARGCDAIIVQNPAPVRLDYDPFAVSQTLGRMAFEVENRGTDECDVDIVLFGTDRVPLADVTVADTGVMVAVTPGAADGVLTRTPLPGVWRTHLAAGRRTRLALQAAISRDAVAEAGQHSVELMLEVRDADAQTARSAAVPATITLVSVARAQINIAGAAGNFGSGTAISSVDFGVFESNASRRVFLQVRANTPARLTIDSANLGRLKLAEAHEVEQGVPYTAILLDEPVDLTRHWQRDIDLPRTVAGRSLPFDLKLGTIGPHMAGAYSDVLTIELSSL